VHNASYLRGTSDHVLNEVAMTGSIDDCDIILGSLKFPQRNINCNTTLTLRFQLVQNPRVFERPFAHLQHNIADVPDSTQQLLLHTRTFKGPLSGTTWVSKYQKGKTSLDFTEARDSQWQWHQLGHMQVYTLLQTDNHTSTPPLSFLQARCPSCRPTNSVKALKAPLVHYKNNITLLILLFAYKQI